VVQASTRKGQLSFRDHLCLIVASDEGFVCVTNDKALRKACDDKGVATLWGLEIMTALVRGRAMQAVDAIETAERISASNPLHIPKKLVDHFKKLVTGIEKKGSGG
jgi:hypothetical protein